jgi:hypothetical protein
MKKDIGFVEYMDEASAGVAKDALHNYKLDGENKIKVCLNYIETILWTHFDILDYIRKKITAAFVAQL